MKKGMLNRRYRQTEDAILDVLLKMDKMPSVGELTRKARISRSTLYRHHRAIPGIVPDYEREVLKEYRRLIRKMLKRDKVKFKNVFSRTLFFVAQRKKMFEILFKYEGGRVMERMMQELEELILAEYHLPKNSKRIMRIHEKEVGGLVEMWGTEKFSEDGMEKVLKDAMYLTETMRGRLGAIRE